LAFLTQNKAKLCKKFIITLVFEKNSNFFAENGQKSQKIVIITSVPGLRFSGDVAKKVTQLPTQYETWLTKGLPRGEEVCHPQLDSLAER
jgi:hypothetical protein